MTVIPSVPPDGPADPRSRLARTVIALFMAAILVGALTTLQEWFNASDRGRAVQTALAFRVHPSSPTFGEMLSRRNGGAPPACTATIASTCSGVVIVQCRVASDREPYRFAVHLLKRRAEAADEATRRRLEIPPRSREGRRGRGCLNGRARVI